MNKKTGAKSARVKKRRTARLKKASGTAAAKRRKAGVWIGGKKKSTKSGRGKGLRKKRLLSASGRRRTAVGAAHSQAFNEGYDSGFQAGFSHGVADGEHILAEAAAG
ncbi:FliH/SctL family protein [Paenibacillus chitinolyticus]|uniref:hypothetical protein n=1 Tax=Paenibacillus chitinolyticus TaxID=79263 RepID=UPI003639D8EB